MESIYQKALGSEFDRLHPKLQQRYGFSSQSGKSVIGRGVMKKLWHGKPYTWPGLLIGAFRNIMFLEGGTDVPFVIENYAYRDRYGRETVSWVRTFELSKRRRFDEYMVQGKEPGHLFIYLGTHQHLVADVYLSVDSRGGMVMRSGGQRFYEGRVAFKFPMLFSGAVDVCEWYDDKEEKYQVTADIKNSWMGSIFGYFGEFDIEWGSGDVPVSCKPKREEWRT